VEAKLLEETCIAFTDMYMKSPVQRIHTI